MTSQRPTDQELAATARKAVDDYRYATELPYFLDKESCEYEPFMLILRSVLAEHGNHPKSAICYKPTVNKPPLLVEETNPMTQEQHSMAPPPEVVKQWITKYGNSEDPHWQTYEQDIATQAANWGATMELEACCEWLRQFKPEGYVLSAQLRAARRPKPKSMAEEGYDALDTYIYGNPDPGDKERTYNTLRCALKRLQELEGQE